MAVKIEGERESHAAGNHKLEISVFTTLTHNFQIFQISHSSVPLSSDILKFSDKFLTYAVS